MTRSSRILSFRGPKNSVDPLKPNAAFIEREQCDRQGDTIDCLTILLTGAECPLRCTMCDLWKTTLDGPTPIGALPTQIENAISHHPPADWIKLYNASNFFDPLAVPPDDLPRIADLLRPFSRVIVENHPRFINPAVIDFRNQIPGQLEVAVGVESIDDTILKSLNKQATRSDFERVFHWLIENKVDVRAFVLLQPPGVASDESVERCTESVIWAEQNGARHITIIPTRGGNGIMERLAKSGEFEAPSAEKLDMALSECLARTTTAVITADTFGLTPS